MQSETPALDRPARLVPLLRSIGQELVERADALVRLEERIASLSPRMHGDEIARHRAEAAAHKRELRYAQRELEKLGCSIDGIDPLTFRIGVDETVDFLWTLGSPALSPSAS
jgi:hypothetical protein